MTDIASIADLLPTLPPASSPARTHYGRDVTTTPAQHLPVLLHPTPTLPSLPPAASSALPAPAAASSTGNTDICFFDLETTFPSKQCPAELIEYGCLLVNRSGWYETAVYGTLIRPLVSRVSKRSIDCNGITEAMLATAPTFGDVAPLVYSLMHGRLWCGHNIKSFDIPQLHRAFDAVSHPRPSCAGVIDTLHLVRAHFRDRANGSNAMSALSQYFGLGEEKHRAVSDCKQTLDAIKGVALSLFMERELSELFPTPVVPARTYRRRESGEVKEEVDEHDKAAEQTERAAAEDDAKEPLLSASKSDRVSATPPSTTGKRPRGRPRKLPAPATAPMAELGEAMRKLKMDGEEEGGGGKDGDKKDGQVAVLREEEDEIQELEEELDEDEDEDEEDQSAVHIRPAVAAYGGYTAVSTVESKEDEMAEASVRADAAEAVSDGSTSPLLPHSTAPPVPPPPAVSAALIALLDTAASSPSSSFHFVYAGGNPTLHSTLRSAVSVQWQHRPYTFTAVVPHMGRYVSEVGGGSEGVRLCFSAGKVSEVRNGKDELPVWTSGLD